MPNVKRRVGTMPSARIDNVGTTYRPRDTARPFTGTRPLPRPLREKIADDAADRTMSAGYTARNRMCNRCHTRASNTGVCMC